MSIDRSPEPCPVGHPGCTAPGRSPRHGSPHMHCCSPSPMHPQPCTHPHGQCTHLMTSELTFLQMSQKARDKHGCGDSQILMGFMTLQHLTTSPTPHAGQKCASLE